jgi:RHS repeat-associated protein
VTALTDHTGALSVSYETDAFGNLLDQKGAVPNPFIFTAREYESEIGLYYYRARYYDPSFARFLNRDPQWDEAKLNQYAYALNAPTRYRDPLGLWETDEEILRNHGLTWETFRKHLVAPEERKIRLMGLDRRIPGEGSSWTPKQYAERLLLNRLNDMKQELRGEYAIKSLRKGIALEIRDYRSYNRLSRDEQAFAMIRMERALAKLESAAPEAPARAAEAQGQPLRFTKVDTGGGAPPRPGVPTGKHGFAQPGAAPSEPQPQAPAAQGGAVVAKSQPSSPRVVVNPQPGKGVNPTPRYMGPQGLNTGADDHNWQKISTKPTAPPTTKEPFAERFLKPDPNAGIVLSLVLTTEKIFQCRNAGMSAGDCAYEMLKAAALGAPIALAALTVPYAGPVIVVVGGVAMTIKGFNDLVEYGYGRKDARDAQNRLESILKERGQWAKVFKEARFDDDLRDIRERIESDLNGLIQEHKIVCRELDEMLENVPQWAKEAEKIGYRLPTGDTIKRWEEIANRCMKAGGKKESDKRVEALRNEALKFGRDLNSNFRRAESLAQACEDWEDAEAIMNVILSCENDSYKIKERAKEARWLGNEANPLGTEAWNTKSQLETALKDRDQLFALKDKIPSLKAWEGEVRKAEATKDALLQKAKELDRRVKNLQMSYESAIKSDEEYKLYELRKPLITIENQICDIEAKRKLFQDSYDRLVEFQETAVIRLANGLKLNEALWECLKDGQINLIADIEKVQKEADKIMTGIPGLKQAADRCHKIRYLICVDSDKTSKGEPLGKLEITGQKKIYEKQKTWHVVIGGPHESGEKAELSYLQVAQGARPLGEPGRLAGRQYVYAGGRKCLVDHEMVENLLKKQQEVVASLPKERVDDLKPKENEWFVYVNVVDGSGNGIPTASVYSHDIGGYQSENLGGGRYRVGPFWKRSPTDKRSIEIRAEAMFRSAQSFAYMPKYKNVPVLLADQSIVEVTIQFTEEGDFMKDDRPSFITESSVETKDDLKPPSFVRDSSVEPGSSLRTPGGRGEGEEEPPEFIKRSVPRTTIGKSTVGATSPASPGVRPELRTPETPAQPPTTPQGQCVDKNGRPTLLCTEFNAPLSR